MSATPEEIAANQKLKQATTSTMGEYLYSLHSGHPQYQRQDLTPYSAVSSFNLPAQYDSSLMTPVSITSSPSLSTKAPPLIRGERDFKLSPSTLSPYHYYVDDEDFGTRYNPPMKHKDPSSTLQMQTIDSPFSSPYPCPEPYFGSYSVSATPGSGRTMESSPSIQQSPKLSSAGGMSSGSYHSYHQTPPRSATSSASYRSNAAPILIAPNPLSLRPATKQEKGPYRQNSIQSTQSSVSSQGFSEATGSGSPPRGKKRKSPTISTPEEDLILPNDLTHEEHVLLDLRGTGQYAWKEIATRFTEETGKAMKVPALQMRKKRLVERLRENTLNVAWENGNKPLWDLTAERMEESGGSKTKGTKLALEKRWIEEHPSNSSYNAPEQEMLPRKQRTSRDTSSWPDERRSVSHSLHEGDHSRLMSALSSSTMDEVRSRAVVDSDAHFQTRQRQQQHHQLQQRNSPQQPQQSQKQLQNQDQMTFDQSDQQLRRNW